MNRLILTMILFSTGLYAQSPATQPTPVKPVAPEAKEAAKEQVTALEKAGLQKIAQDYQLVLQELSQANIDVSKNHPGFHLDPKNPLSGILVPNEPAQKPDPAKPAAKN